MRWRNGLIILTATVALIGCFAAAGAAQAAFGDTSTYISQFYSGDGGQALNAFFDFPEDLFITSGGTIWIADTMNNVVRRIAPDGTTSTYAGTGHYGLVNGSRTSAQFGFPQGIAVAADGTAYIADTANNALRRISAAGSVATLSSVLKNPQGLALGNGVLFIADTGSNTIKRLNLASNSLSTLTTAIKAPRKIVLSADGSTLYAVDNGNYRVVAINTSNGAVSVIAGNGSKGYQEGIGTNAQFYDPAGIGLDSSTGTLYVGDIGADRIAMIRKIHLTTGATSQWVYDSGMTAVNERSSMRVHDGYLYLAGTGSIHRYALADPAVNNKVGGLDRYQLREGALDQSLLARPGDFAMTNDRQYIYVAGAHKILKIDRTSGQLSFIIGSSVDNYVEGTGGTARFSGISGIAVNSSNSTLYVVDRFNNRLRKVDIATATSTHLSGTGEINTTGPGNGYAEGSASEARFSNPVDLVLSPDEQFAYVSDAGNNRIRKLNLTTGDTALVAGGAEGFTDGIGAAAKFNNPSGLAIDSTGTYLYVADKDNHALRRIRLSDGLVATIAGTGKAGYSDAIGTQAVLNLPTALALDGTRLYFTDSGSHRIRLYELDTRVTKLVAGSGTRGFSNGSRTAAKFNNLSGLLSDSAIGRLFVGDLWNDLIRVVNVTGTAPFTNSAPTIRAVEPATVPKSASVARIALRGTNFRHGIQVKFGSFSVTSFVESSTKLAIVVPIAQMETGWYDAKVTTVDGQTATKLAAFGLSPRGSRVVPPVQHPLPSSDGFFAFPSTFTTGTATIAADVTGDGIPEFLSASGVGALPTVRILRANGTLLRSFRTHPSGVRGGLNLAVADLDHDGTPEILAAPLAGSGDLRVLSPTGRQIRRLFPFGTSNRSGMSVAVGDVTGDGVLDIVVGQATGGTGLRVISPTGKTLRRFNTFAPSKAGIRIALVDLNADSVKDIAAVPASGRVRMRGFTAGGTKIIDRQIFSTTVTTGANIAVGSVTGDSTPELIFSLRPGNRPIVQVMSLNMKILKRFEAFSTRYRGGVNISVADTTSDGTSEIITSTMSSWPQVIVYDANGKIVQ